MVKAAFLYVAPECSAASQFAVIPGKELTLTVMGCSSYGEAEVVAATLVKRGIQAIELCAGFGSEGVARIKQAVGPGIPVGAVRFDFHPAFDFKSGDDMFQ